MTESAIAEMGMQYQREEKNPEAAIIQIVENHNHTRGSLIAVLEEIQAECGYLPEYALRTVADRKGLSLVDLYGIATFYRAFSLKPRGKHVISVCLGTACHIRNAPMVIAEFQRQLGVQVGDTTPDREYSLEAVNCLGACALGPIVFVDGHYFTNVNATKVKGILKKVQAGLPPVDEASVEM
jgi:NADH:ubiquinone oxidoreductase subunit E